MASKGFQEPIFDPSPLEVIEPIYSAISDGQEPPQLHDRLDLLTPRLAEFVETEYELHRYSDSPGWLDFNVLVSAQEWELSEVEITHHYPRVTLPDMEVIDNDHAIVTVDFLNYGQPTQLRYYLDLGEDEVWRIDDIASSDGWVLSHYLKYGESP